MNSPMSTGKKNKIEFGVADIFVFVMAEEKRLKWIAKLLEPII